MAALIVVRSCSSSFALFVAARTIRIIPQARAGVRRAPRPLPAARSSRA